VRPTETDEHREAELSSRQPATVGMDEEAVQAERERPAGRGRRKRRSDSPKSPRHSSASRSREDAPEKGAAGKRRDKSRGRKKQSSRGVENKSEPDQVSAAEPVEPEGDDEGYGNWTVPSWSELISSLYRPER
jgi:hypothetical protein